MPDGFRQSRVSSSQMCAVSINPITRHDSQMNFELLPPRDQILATMARIYAHNMTTTSGGNISVRDENGDIWITPARVDKGELRRDDIVRIRPDGSVEGPHPPSSELPFHLGIYAARPDIRAIIHAHPGALVSFSICGQIPDTRLFPETRLVCGDVAFAKYAVPGSTLLGERIAEQFSGPDLPSCVILENHGVVVGGESLARTFQRFETLEFLARTLILARQLGSCRYLTESQIDLARTESLHSLPECGELKPTSAEKEACQQVCEFVHRAYSHRLMSSAWGSFSARLGPDSFVVTPRHLDRNALSPEDLVIVRDGRCSRGMHPSRAARLHLAIYRAHPTIKSVANALPVHGAAFCVSDFALDTRTIPESFLFLKDVRTIPFNLTFTHPESVASLVGPDQPVALLANNGVLVAGLSVLDAFDRLEVLESTAAAIIDSRALGPITPMPQAVIEELLAAFPSV